MVGRYSGKEFSPPIFAALLKGKEERQRLEEEKDHLSKVGFIIGLHGWGEDSQKRGCWKMRLAPYSYVYMWEVRMRHRISHCKQSTHL